MTLVEKKIYKMRPGYLHRFDDLVKRFSQFGGGAEADKYIGGHGFSNAYEFYIFAFFIGLYNGRASDLSPHDKLVDFWEIENWKPRALTDQLIACALAVCDFDLVGVENFEEAEVTQEVKKLKSSIEQYANGGFELIETIVKDSPDEVTNDDFFVKMLTLNESAQC
ncbi:MAG: hypothetical protein P8O79_10645 [Halieaceae bacterium]|nr:hypothetical protein [Halieaceae bacterium]